MNNKFYKGQTGIINPELAKGNKSLAELIEEDCNNFLKSNEGRRYLSSRYPDLSLTEAIKEYKINAAIACNF